MVGAGALLGLNAAGAAGEAGPQSGPESGRALRRSCLRWRGCAATRRAALQAGTARGRMPMRFRVEAGQAATLLDIAGAGVVTHIWFTIDSPDPMHLKNLVLRAWWDGESTPSVESPDRRLLRAGTGRVLHLPVGSMAVAPHQGAECLLQDAVFECGDDHRDQRRQAAAPTACISPWIT